MSAEQPETQDLQPIATLETIKRQLREAGMKVTPARCKVLAVLLQSESPMSHNEVIDALEAEGANTMDRATVYRNLMSLTEASLVERLDVGDHVWRFHYAHHAKPAGETSAHHEDEGHPHFVCSECKQVMCLPDAVLEALINASLGQAAKVDSVVVRGVCDTCYDEA